MRTSFQICILSIVALFVGVAAPRVNAQCSADLNADHSVTAQDLAIMLAFWGPTTTFAAADINQDHIVNAQDLAMLLAMWGPCAAPSWGIPIEWAPNPAVVTDANFRQRMIATGLPWRVRDNGTQMEMLLVPPGTYMMGASKDDSEATKEEYPAHEVTLTHAFYLSRTEVTQATWQATMQQKDPSSFHGATLPVNNLTFDQANQFCAASSMRLPTEAEWEYACRGGNTTPRYGALDDIGWYIANSQLSTHPVAEKLPNPLGFYDMIGNVREWCQDWYSDYTAAAVVDPMGPKSGDVRILRGGSWVISAAYCRASIRVETATLFTFSIGFRAARNP